MPLTVYTSPAVYAAITLALMLILPIVSSLLEVFLGNHGAFAPGIFLRWFVFWAVGVGLLLAGMRQIVQPQHTAETLLGTKSSDAGMTHLSIGIVGAFSIVDADWIVPVGLVGALTYGLAGIKHVLHKPRARNQNIALVSDLGIALVLGVLLLPI
jgi:hypothetical protein